MRPLIRASVALVTCSLAPLACGETDHLSPAACEAGAAGMGSEAYDADGDGFERLECGGEDCDDSRDDIYPAADETCDGDDNDCDGVVDQEAACDCAEPPPEPTLPFTERVCLTGGWFAMGMGVTDPHAPNIAYKVVAKKAAKRASRK